jgi:hypothetical protein
MSSVKLGAYYGIGNSGIDVWVEGFVGMREF